MPENCLYSEPYVLGASAQNLYHLTGALAEKGLGLAERQVAQKPKVLLLCSKVNQECELSTAVSVTLHVEDRITSNTSSLVQDSCKHCRKLMCINAP